MSNFTATYIASIQHSLTESMFLRLTYVTKVKPRNSKAFTPWTSCVEGLLGFLLLCFGCFGFSWLFVGGFSSRLKHFHSNRDVTFTGEGLQNFDPCWALISLKGKGSLASHTYYDTLHLIICSYPRTKACLSHARRTHSPTVEVCSTHFTK